MPDNVEPYAAFVDMVRAWCRDNPDHLDAAYFGVEPGSITLILVCLMPHRSNVPTGDLIRGLIRRLEVDGLIPSGVEFDSIGVNMPALRKSAFPVNDPDAASKIADRVRTADGLRAELTRVMAERDESRGLDYAVARVRAGLAGMDDEERIDFVAERIMDGYCKECGSDGLPCYCSPGYDI